MDINIKGYCTDARMTFFVTVQAGFKVKERLKQIGFRWNQKDVQWDACFSYEITDATNKPEWDTLDFVPRLEEATGRYRDRWSVEILG